MIMIAYVLSAVKVVILTVDVAMDQSCGVRAVETQSTFPIEAAVILCPKMVLTPCLDLNFL